MIYEVKRRSAEIDDVLNRAWDSDEEGSRYPGMTFEQGVREAIEWITGNQDDMPLPPRDED